MVVSRYIRPTSIENGSPYLLDSSIAGLWSMSFIILNPTLMSTCQEGTWTNMFMDPDCARLLGLPAARARHQEMNDLLQN